MIKVGAATEAEMKERKDRVDDALHATRAAVQEGIVAGGGTAYLRASAVIDGLKLEGDAKIGAQIIKSALQLPTVTIAENAGKEGAVIVNRVLKEKGNVGYNAKTDVFEDLVKAGVIDPVKVSKSALTNAASVATLLLNTEAMIAEIKEPKKDKGGGGHHDEGGGGMGGMGGMGGDGRDGRLLARRPGLTAGRLRGATAPRERPTACPPRPGQPRASPTASLPSFLTQQTTNTHSRIIAMASVKTASKTTIRPLDDRIVVTRTEAQQTSTGGIILPENAKEKPQQGKVLAVGQGKLLDNGTRAKPDVAAGDTILFGKYSGTELTVDGQEIIILRESDILAKLG